MHPQKNEENQYLCSVCQNPFKSYHGLMFHIRGDHFPLKKYPCTQCEKVFTEKHLLNNHVVRHHSTGQNYPCSECDAKFSTPSARYRHNLKEHRKAEFVCQKCGKSFKEKSKL